jgi:hypothetical protein
MSYCFLEGVDWKIRAHAETDLRVFVRLGANGSTATPSRSGPAWHERAAFPDIPSVENPNTMQHLMPQAGGPNELGGQV